MADQQPAVSNTPGAAQEVSQPSFRRRFDAQRKQLLDFP